MKNRINDAVLNDVVLMVSSLVMIQSVMTPACAEADLPEFDRPGIAYAASVLPQGMFSWEQGLPSVFIDDADGVKMQAWTADSVLRLGLGAAMEIQLGMDSYGKVREKDDAGSHARRGSGDGWITLKWAPETGREQYSLAWVATASVPRDEAPLGTAEHQYAAGVMLERLLSEDSSVWSYLEYDWDDATHGWLFSPGYGFSAGAIGEVYIEAGFGSGMAYTRVLGAGITRMLTSRLQLDFSLLRGLNDKSPTWQGGIGVACLFD